MAVVQEKKPMFISLVPFFLYFAALIKLKCTTINTVIKSTDGLSVTRIM